MGKFTAQVDSWIAESQKRMQAVRNYSVEAVIDNAQQPTAKGGRMRVDTGFLRASGQLSLNGMPSGPVRGDPDQTYGESGKPISVILASASLTADLYFGWTANYARPREAKDGFLRLAVQKWPQFVAEATAKAKSRGAR